MRRGRLVFRSEAASPLEQCGFEVREFAAGEEALEFLRKQAPSLVLLEVRLPGICGYEVCRALRDEFGNDLPIVFVSDDRTERRDRIAGLLVGADDYLPKPVTLAAQPSRGSRSLHVEGVAVLRRVVVGEISKDRADLARKPHGHGSLLGEAGGVPVHLRQQ